MDNKELPQEVVNEIKQCEIHYCGGDYEGGLKGAVKNNLIQSYTIGAQIAHSHYLKELQAKDTTIKELQEKNEKLIGLFEKFYKDAVIHIGVNEENEEGETMAYAQASDMANDGWDRYKEQHGI